MSSLRNNSKYQSPAKGVSPSKNVSRSSGFGISAKSTKGMQSSNEFSRQIKNAQNHAEENIEDEYIKNLQQQIAYMELELKLLKEKELEQKQSVSQIDKFFNDGVPLNENILALKNQYQHNKKQYENRIDELNELRMEEIKQAADLKNNYERSASALRTIIDALDKKEKEYTSQMSQARMAFLNERNRRVQAEKDFRKLQHTIKEVNSENLKMQRDLERESVLVHHREEMLTNKRQKTKEDIKAKEDWIVSLSKDVEKKRSAATYNPEVTMLENENLDLSAKVIRCEKEANIAKAKVKEMEMFLESRRRERQLESQQKRDLVTKISTVKFQIDEQNKMNEVEIKKKVEDKEDKERKDLNKEIEEVKTGKTIVKQRQSEKESAIRALAEEKMGVQQDLLTLEQETSSLDKEFKEKSEVLILLKNSQEALTLEEKELEEKLEPVEKDITKMKKMIPLIEKHNEELRERIAHEEKKNELSMQIKNVNLEELMLLVQSNDQVQNTIGDMMKKWDFLQRLNLGDA